MRRCTHVPQASGGRMYRPRRPRASALYQCATRHAPELKAGGRFGRRVEESVIERFLECGDPAPWVRERKFWPAVGRIDDAYATATSAPARR